MIKIKTCLVLLNLLIATLFINAQAPGYSFSLFTQNDGIASGTITRIERDSTGFIWLMSEKGLTRFDGYDFVIYRHDPNNPKSIPAHYVLDMKVNSLKEVFFRTENHICYYNPGASTFSTVFSISTGNEFRDWTVVDSALWILTRLSMYKLTARGSVMHEIRLPGESSGKIGALKYRDGKDLIWIGCKNSMIAIEASSDKIVFNEPIQPGYDVLPVPIHFYTNQNGVPCFFSKAGYFMLNEKDQIFTQYHSTRIDLTDKFSLVRCFNLSSDYLITALMNGSIYKVDKNSGLETAFYLSDYIDKDLAPSKPIINGIYNTPDQKIWISTPGSGIYYADFSASSFQLLSLNSVLEPELPYPFCNYIMHDGKILWISIAGSGLIKGESFIPYFKSYKPESKKGNAITPLFYNVRSVVEKPDSSLFVGSLNDLSVFNLKNKKFEPSLPGKLASSGLDRIPIGKILEDDSGNFWFGTWNETSLLKSSSDFKDVYRFTFPPTSNPASISIRSLCIVDSDLWIGTATSGLFVLRNYHDSYSQIEKLELHGLSGSQAVKNVYSILRNKDVVYAATGNGLLMHRLNDKKTALFKNQPGNYETLSYNDTRSLAFDKSGMIWVGTNGGGLNCFNPEDKKFKSFKTENGLPDNFIYSIAADASGKLWLGTNNGLCCFNPVTFQTQNFSAKDKLQNLEFNTGSCITLSSGELCFGGVNGINIFHPDSVISVYPPVNLVLTNFRIDNKPRNYESSQINLSYAENNLTFEFAVLSFFRNDETRYAYKLEGADRDWIFSGNRRFAHYAQLPPGEYTFYAKAMDKSGAWSPPFEFLQIHIAAPWYNQWWFYTLALLLISSIIYMLFHFRLKQKLQIQMLRNKIARDLHDEIGSNLSSISLFSTVAAGKTHQANADTQALLKKITDFTQVSMEAMNDIVWMINTKNDRFENIITRMRELAVELFEAKSIELEMSFDEHLAQQKMGMEERKNFYLIYKEALNNVLKYSSCRKVTVRLFRKPGYIVLEIIDDGRGFETDLLHRGNGLANIQTRANALNGKLNISSVPGKGTHVILQFPV